MYAYVHGWECVQVCAYESMCMCVEVCGGAVRARPGLGQAQDLKALSLL